MATKTLLRSLFGALLPKADTKNEAGVSSISRRRSSLR